MKCSLPQNIIFSKVISLKKCRFLIFKKNGINCPETMSLFHVRSKFYIAPFHVRSKVCIAPFHGRGKVYKFAPYMDGSNANFAPHMEGSHADYTPHMERRHSCRHQLIANFAFFFNSRKYFLSHIFLRSWYNLWENFSEYFYFRELALYGKNKKCMIIKRPSNRHKREGEVKTAAIIIGGCKKWKMNKFFGLTLIRIGKNIRSKKTLWELFLTSTSPWGSTRNPLKS